MTGLVEQTIQREGDCRAPTWSNDHALGEISDGDVLAPRGAVGSEGHDDLVVAQSLDGERLRDVTGQQTEGGVQLIGGEATEHVLGDALAKTDLDAWVGFSELGQQPRDVDVASGVKRSDPDPPPSDASKLVDFRTRAVQLGQDTSSPRREKLSGLGWSDAAAGALEQRRTQLLLELSNLVRQRRLSDVELLRGSGEMAKADHCLDSPELSQLHANRS